MKPKKPRIRRNGEIWSCDRNGHTIQTERLTIRPLRSDDEGPVLETVDAVVLERHGWTDNDIVRKQFLEGIGPPTKNPYVEHWVIVNRKSEEVMGLRSIWATVDRHATCTTGGWIGAKWRNQGYGTEELTAILQLAHQHLGYCVMLAATEDDNAATIALYTKCGFTEFGRASQQLYEEKMVNAVWLFHAADTTDSCRLQLHTNSRKYPLSDWVMALTFCFIGSSICLFAGRIMNDRFLTTIAPIAIFVVMPWQFLRQRNHTR